MRLGICKQLNIQYFELYTEPQAAAFLKKDASTLKRWRGKKLIHPVAEVGGKGIRYFGFQIADIYMGNPEPWQATENTGSASIGSPAAETAPTGTGVGLKAEPQSASRLVAQHLRKPRQG